jgi:NitT/TauT family transport system substrate-binding protein
MRARTLITALLVCAALVTPVTGQDLPKVTVAMSGWTGFAPLTLAEKAGLFKKQGVDATIKFIPRRTGTWPSPPATCSARPPRSRRGSSGTPTACATKQVVQLDKSYGADGMVVRNTIGRSPT